MKAFLLDPIYCSHRYHEARFDDYQVKNEDDWLWENEEIDLSDDEEVQWEYFTSENKKTKAEVLYDKTKGREIINEDDKLLIFMTGRNSWIPHQIGVKKMSQVEFTYIS